MTTHRASKFGASSPPYTATMLYCYLSPWMWAAYLRTFSSAYISAITLVAKAIALGMACPKHRTRLGSSVLCSVACSCLNCWLVSGPLASSASYMLGRSIIANSLSSFFKSKFHCFDATIIVAGFIIDVCMCTLE